MPPNPWSDHSAALGGLLARVALGDRAAFAALYQASSAQLLGVVLRIQRDRTLAEEVLQEVYIKVWRAASGFEAARSQPMTWLTSIARNGAIDSLRRRKTELATVSTRAAGGVGGAGGAASSGRSASSRASSNPSGDADDDLIDHLPSADAGPLELLQQAAQARQVTHCLQHLSAQQQQCMALSYYQGLSHSEVAQHLGQPLGSVKSWVRRALLSLKDCLDRAQHTVAHGKASATLGQGSG